MIIIIHILNDRKAQSPSTLPLKIVKTNYTKVIFLFPLKHPRSIKQIRGFSLKFVEEMEKQWNPQRKLIAHKLLSDSDQTFSRKSIAKRLSVSKARLAVPTPDHSSFESVFYKKVYLDVWFLILIKICWDVFLDWMVSKLLA